VSEYHADAWSRLSRWLKTELDSCQAQIMSGACPPDEYRALCKEAARIQSTLNQMKLIQSGQDISDKHIPSPLRAVE
jgi:hypothetical protein